MKRLIIEVSDLKVTIVQQSHFGQEFSNSGARFTADGIPEWSLIVDDGEPAEYKKGFYMLGSPRMAVKSFSVNSEVSLDVLKKLVLAYNQAHSNNTLEMEDVCIEG